MSEHVAFLLRGAGSGGVFAALAMALVVTYRSSGVVNFATGAVALYVAETYARLRTGTLFVPFPGLPAEVDMGGRVRFLPAVAISLGIAMVLGLLLHYLVFRPLRSASAVAKAVASIGVMIVMQAVVSIRLGFDPIVTEAILPDDNIEVMGETVRSDRLWFAAAVVGLALVLGVLFRYTRFGIATRAVAESEKGAFVTGLSPERISRANWALSAVVSGVAGILISPIVPIAPVSYTLFIVPALAAALVGGFSAVGPAVAAGLAIGMIQSELVFLQLEISWLPDAGTPELVPLIVILFVLVLRGRPLPDRGAVITRTLGRAPRPERLLPTTLVSAAVGIGAVLLLSGGYRFALILTFIYALIALSWVVVTGYAGQVSFAQLSLAGVGAFALHRFAETLDIPFPLAPLLAALVAAVIGVVVGLPALRIRGLPVAVVTLALATALEAVWFKNPEYNGGLEGANISSPSLFGLDFGVSAQDSRVPFALMALTVLVVVALGLALLRRHRLGAAMLAVKANERSAAAAGIDVARTKLIAFGLGAFIAGLAGALLAYLQSAAVPQTYTAFIGVGLFATVFLSGINSIAGGINAGVIGAGGVFFTVLNRSVDLSVWYTAIAGALLVLTVISHPDGVMGTLQHRIAERRRPASVPRSQRATGTITSGVEAMQRSPRTVRADADRTPVLSVHGIGVRYGAVTAVDDVSFDVRPGQIVGLIGPNGAGKTTLIDAISGFVDCTGWVELDREEVDDLSPHRRARRGMARTFQSVELYDDLTVEENIEVGQVAARGRRESRTASDREDIDLLCRLLQLDEVRHRPVKELSAGHRQLVSVGRALAGRPKVLLLDEPAAGLDTDESRWLGERLHDVRDAGITVVMIDHDMSLVLGVCDEIHVLDLGTRIASGSPAEISHDPRVAEAYLGTRATVGGAA